MIIAFTLRIVCPLNSSSLTVVIQASSEKHWKFKVVLQFLAGRITRKLSIRGKHFEANIYSLHSNGIGHIVSEGFLKRCHLILWVRNCEPIFYVVLPRPPFQTLWTLLTTSTVLTTTSAAALIRSRVVAAVVVKVTPTPIKCYPLSNELSKGPGERPRYHPSPPHHPHRQISLLLMTP